MTTRPLPWVNDGAPALSADNLNDLEADLALAMWSVAGLSTKTANYTATGTDRVLIFNGSSLTATLPDPTTVSKKLFLIKNIHSSALTVVSAGTSKTIDSAASIFVGQNMVLQVVSDGTQWLVLSGGSQVMYRSSASGSGYTFFTSAAGETWINRPSGNSSDALVVSYDGSTKFFAMTGDGSITRMNATNVAIKVNGTSPNGNSYTSQRVGLMFGDALQPIGSNARVWLKMWDPYGNNGWGSPTQATMYVTKTANFTLTQAEECVIFDGSSLTATLPDPTNNLMAARIYTIKNIHSTSLSIVSAGTSKTIDGASSKSLAQWEKMRVMSDGTQWLII